MCQFVVMQHITNQLRHVHLLEISIQIVSISAFQIRSIQVPKQITDNGLENTVTVSKEIHRRNLTGACHHFRNLVPVLVTPQRGPCGPRQHARQRL
jgi:hypothetical protein